MKKNKQAQVMKKITKKLAKDVLQVLQEAGSKELNNKQIAAKLGIDDTPTRNLIHEILEDFAWKDVVEKTRTGKFKISAGHLQSYVEGRVDMMSSGNAYVIVDGMAEDVFISARNVNNALHGDTVKVYLFAKRRDRRPEGEIVEILERSRTEFVGTMEVSDRFAFLVPDNEKMRMDIFVPLKDLKGAQNGYKAVVRITEWPSGTKSPVGEVVEVIGKPGDNETEMHAILAEFGFPIKFPESVEAEAAQIPFEIDKEEIARRRDMRSITTFTIDPEDAKDFDDALSIEYLPNGHYSIGVHIADVSHYIPEKSQLEKEAMKRATSVYLVDRVVPMLPEKLSNGVCSLRPHEEKLCFSAVFEMNDKAEVLNTWFGRTVIYSDRRFTYEEAQKVIETGEGDLKTEILKFHELASILRKRRFADGALRVEQSEVKFKLDAKGKPIGVYFKVSKEANHLIEEFMLLANRKVAEFVGIKDKRQKQIKTFVYRVHDAPDMEKLKEFKRLAANFGYKLDLSNKKTIAQSLNTLLTEVKGKPEASMLESLSIRSMAKAIYTTENIGHYGLAFDYYTHFTSPIRRYPDVMVHRLLQRYLDNGTSVKAADFELKCRHSSDMERKAAEAERASTKYKQVEYMKDHVGEIFEGVISGVTEWGLYVEIVANKCEGMIRLRDMNDDHYVFDERNYMIRGNRFGKMYRLGDKIQIEVKGANLEKRQLDFRLAD